MKNIRRSGHPLKIYCFCF